MDNRDSVGCELIADGIHPSGDHAAQGNQNNLTLEEIHDFIVDLSIGAKNGGIKVVPVIGTL